VERSLKLAAFHADGQEVLVVEAHSQQYVLGHVPMEAAHGYHMQHFHQAGVAVVRLQRLHIRGCNPQGIGCLYQEPSHVRGAPLQLHRAPACKSVQRLPSVVLAEHPRIQTLQTNLRTNLLVQVQPPPPSKKRSLSLQVDRGPPPHAPQAHQTVRLPMQTLIAAPLLHIGLWKEPSAWESSASVSEAFLGV